MERAREEREKGSLKHVISREEASIDLEINNSQSSFAKINLENLAKLEMRNRLANSTNFHPSGSLLHGRKPKRKVRRALYTPPGAGRGWSIRACPPVKTSLEFGGGSSRPVSRRVISARVGWGSGQVSPIDRSVKAGKQNLVAGWTALK